MQQRERIAIIGAGIGGLATAIRLAEYGYSVEVFESSSSVGGKAGVISEKGYRFDAGPSLLTYPEEFYELIAEVAGKKDLFEKLKITKLENLAKYYFPDGTIYTAPADWEKFTKEAVKNLDTNHNELEKYKQYIERLNRLGGDVFLNNSLDTPSTYTTPKNLAKLIQLFKLDIFRSMNKANKKFFSDERLVKIFNGYATYNGSDPYQAPATLNIIAHVEHIQGGYYPKKGIYTLVKALSECADNLGVKINLNSAVTEITFSQVGNTNIATGIKTTTEELEFDAIVSNVDLNTTYKRLIKTNNKRIPEWERYKNSEGSSSALVFYWGVKREFPELDIHNLFFSNDYEREFGEIFLQKNFPKDPTVYINVSSKYCRSDAPEGCENWFVMINAPIITKENRLTSNKIAKIKKIILKKIANNIESNISAEELAELIEFEEILSPETLEQKGNYRGSLYGISSNSKLSAFYRQQNQSNYISNLFFVGGSVHPGGGIPLVMKSARLAANKVINSIK